MSTYTSPVSPAGRRGRGRGRAFTMVEVMVVVVVLAVLAGIGVLSYHRATRQAAIEAAQANARTIVAATLNDAGLRMAQQFERDRVVDQMVTMFGKPPIDGEPGDDEWALLGAEDQLTANRQFGLAFSDSGVVNGDAGTRVTVATYVEGVVVSATGSLWGTVTVDESHAAISAGQAIGSDPDETGAGGDPEAPQHAFLRIAGGSKHSLAVVADGTVWAWGSNSFGQLGDGLTAESRRTPGKVLTPSDRTFIQVAGGNSHSLALASDGTVWAWGYNTRGMLGDGTTTDRHAPVQVKGTAWGNRAITQIASGRNHVLALASDGTVWAWGFNDCGQLGNGKTNAAQPNPNAIQVQAPWGDQPITKIAAGMDHSLAVASDGTVWAWGSNQYGTLGDGTTTDRNVPVRVIGLEGKTITQMEVGSYHSLALASDGTVWAWGANLNGALGDGTATDRKSPVQVLGLEGKRIVQVAAGSSESVALASDGTVWAWGNNDFGTSPGGGNRAAQVIGLADKTIIEVAEGGSHALVVASDGTVWAWGLSHNGQLGEAEYAFSRETPVGPIALPSIF